MTNGELGVSIGVAGDTLVRIREPNTIRDIAIRDLATKAPWHWVGLQSDLFSTDDGGWLDGHTAGWRCVETTGAGECLRVTFGCGRIVVGRDQLFAVDVDVSDSELIWRPARDLQAGDKILVALGLSDQIIGVCNK